MIEDENPVLRRLNALVEVGYAVDRATSHTVRDAIWLDHRPGSGLVTGR